MEKFKGPVSRMKEEWSGRLTGGSMQSQQCINLGSMLGAMLKRKSLDLTDHLRSDLVATSCG